VALVAVPEPQVWALLLGGALFLSMRVFRRTVSKSPKHSDARPQEGCLPCALKNTISN
jgi:hypothetical protein